MVLPLSRPHTMNKLLRSSQLLCVLLVALSGNVFGRKSFYDQIYTFYSGYPCVRLLDDALGVVGCSTGKNGVVGGLHPIDTQGDLTSFLQDPPKNDDLVVLLDSTLFSDSTINSLIGVGSVKGILTTKGPGPKNGYSVAAKNPLQKWSLHPNLQYDWNPQGNGAMYRSYSVPIYGLSENETLIFKQKALENISGSKYPRWGVELTTFMFATHDSETCLRRDKCLPIGGRNVWSVFGSEVETSKDIVMVTATMDSNSFFHDDTLGASAYLSGVVSLLGAVEALTNITNIDTAPRQLAVSLFQGEIWDYIGSMSFVKEATKPGSQDPAAKLGFSRIKQMVDISQVGNPKAKGEFFIHLDRLTQSFNPKTRDLLNKFTYNSNPTSSMAKITNSSSALKTFPPSPLHTFLRANKNIGGIVISDHFDVFTNKYYMSSWDDSTTVDATSNLCPLANSIAKSLYALTFDIDVSLVPQNIAANCTIVEQLYECLTSNLQCQLIQDYVGFIPWNSKPVSYVSVYYPGAYSFQTLFVHQFLSYHTAHQMNTPCKKDSDCADTNGSTCIKGVCIASNTFYQNALPAGLDVDGDWYRVGNSSLPTWTESNWDGTIGIRLFLQDDLVNQILFLVSGLLLTGVGAVIGYASQKVLKDHFKEL